MELDVAKLEQQLQGIYQERQVVNERLRTLGPGRGRGRGPGFVASASFRGGPSSGRGLAGRGVYPGQDHYGPGPNSLAGPSQNGWNDRSYRQDGHPSRPPASARPSVMDRLGPSSVRDNRRPTREADPAPVEAMPAVEPPGSRKRLSSAVVVDGQTKQLSQTDELMTAKRPKTDDTDDNPAAKKRNRRMFGFLNQTLQKSKDESSEFRKSRVAQQRDEALKRAEDRRREELVKFKANFKLEMATKRHTELNLKKELNMQADVKRAEIVLVQKVLRRTLLTNFIQTTAGPPLFWLPGKHNAATQSLLQKEQQKLEGYKLEEAAKVEAKRQEIAGRLAVMAKEVEAAAARRLADAEAATQRRNAAKAAAASGTPDTTAKDEPEAEAEEDMAAEEDEAEDGALEEADYAVGEDEVMQDANMEAQQEDTAGRDASTNGTAVRQPDSAEDDRYVATAYTEGEDQDERVREASQEPAEQGDLGVKPAATEPDAVQKDDKVANESAAPPISLPQQAPEGPSETANPASSSPKEEEVPANAADLQEVRPEHASVQETPKPTDTAEHTQSEAA